MPSGGTAAHPEPVRAEESPAANGPAPGRGATTEAEADRRLAARHGLSATALSRLRAQEDEADEGSARRPGAPRRRRPRAGAREAPAETLDLREPPAPPGAGAPDAAPASPPPVETPATDRRPTVEAPAETEPVDAAPALPIAEAPADRAAPEAPAEARPVRTPDRPAVVGAQAQEATGSVLAPPEPANPLTVVAGLRRLRALVQEASAPPRTHAAGCPCCVPRWERPPPPLDDAPRRVRVVVDDESAPAPRVTPEAPPEPIVHVVPSQSDLSERSIGRLRALAYRARVGRENEEQSLQADEHEQRAQAFVHAAKQRRIFGSRDVRASTAALLQRLEDLPLQPPVAVRLLELLDAGDVDDREMDRLLRADPVLTAKLLHMANSARYAPVTPVTNVHAAVGLLGLGVLRSAATFSAAGLDAEHARWVPAGFWLHAAQCGVACSLVATRLGVPPRDGFALGVLHDLGVALLATSDHAAYDEVLDRMAHGEEACDAEMSLFGISRGEVAARVFTAWHFPGRYVAAVAGHHRPGPAGADPLAQALALGDALAHLANGAPMYDPRADCADQLLIGGILDDEVALLVQRVEIESDRLAASLAP